MTPLKNGSTGDDVTCVQQALQAAGYLNGTADGVFGPATGAAVKQFQAASGLAADGIVGPGTWGKLFPDTAPSPPAPANFGGLDNRCLALTGSFETGSLAPNCFAALTGSFDGQGMSFGALQWNFGQWTLQPLLQQMFTSHADVATTIFGAHLEQLQQAINGSRSAAMAFAVSIQDPAKHTINDPWQQMFKSLGLTPEFQEIETNGAAAYYNRAVTLCSQYGLSSKRGRALMFDICVQNGSINDAVKAQIMADFASLSPSLPPDEMELAKMRIVANRRAEAANSKFVEDVRQRKLCIAEGKGVVHGITYDLAGQFGLDLGVA
jgi:hypothetical protein